MITWQSWVRHVCRDVPALVLAGALAACGGGGNGAGSGIESGDGGGDGGDGGGGDSGAGGEVEPAQLAVGELDPAFGAIDPAGSGNADRLGYTVPPPGASGILSYGVAVATDSKERIIVAGVIDCLDTTTRATIWRFLPDGTPDPDFGGTGGPCVARDPPATPGGGTGYVTFPADSFVHDLALAPDGDMVMAGKINAPGLVGNAIWRFRADGSLDTAFGELPPSGVRTGYTLIDDADGAAAGLESFGGRNAWLGVALDDSGRVLVAGTADAAGTSSRRLVVTRLRADGRVDPTFGDRLAGTPIGFFVFPPMTSPGDDMGFAPLALESGRMLVVGRVQGAANRDGIALRLTSDGELDDTFGEPTGVPGVRSGYRILEYTPGGSRDDGAHAVVVDSADRILVHGISSTSTGTAKVVWRLLPDGDVDTEFENDRQPFFTTGIIETQVTGSVGGKHDDCINRYDAANGLALAAKDRPVVVGCWGMLDKYIAVERYTADGDDDSSFGKGDFLATNAPYAGYFRFTRIVTDDAQDIGSGIALDEKGRVLITGRTPRDSTSTLERMILLRLR